MIRFDHRRGLWNDQPKPRLCSWLGAPMMAGPGTPTPTPPTLTEDGAGTVGTGNTSLTITVGALAAAIGSTIIVGIGWTPATSANVSSVTDDAGNTYTINKQSRTFVGAAVASAPCTATLSAGANVTVNFSSAVAARGHLAVVANLNNASLSDVTASNAGTSTHPTVTTGSTTFANEIAIGVVCWEDNSSVTPDGAWTAIRTGTYDAGASGINSLTWAYKILSALAAQTYAPTLGASVHWTDVIATFKGT